MQPDTNTLLHTIDQVGFMIQVNKNVRIYPRNYIEGRIYSFGFHDKYNFVTIESEYKRFIKKDLFWSVKPLLQTNYPIGERVFIFYDIHNVTELPGLQVFFIYGIKSLPSVSP